MAKCVVTISDDGKGTVDVNAEFDPVIEDSDHMTAAQTVTVDLINLLINYPSAAEVEAEYADGEIVKL